MADADRMQTLREFGFGPYASRAYLALLDVGPADARTVSREARIPAPKVYGTLEALMERGLVRLIVDKPRRYLAVAFAEYLHEQREGHLEEAQRLLHLGKSVASIFTKPPRRAASDRGGVVIHRGRRPILRVQRNLAGRVERELLLLPSAGALRRSSTFSAILADAASVGVRARVVAPGGWPSNRLKEMQQVADVRVAPPHSPAVVVGVTIASFDASQIVLAHHVPDDESLDGQDVGIHITEEAVARRLHETFEAQWDAAAPVGRPGRRAR